MSRLIPLAAQILILLMLLSGCGAKSESTDTGTGSVGDEGGSPTEVPQVDATETPVARSPRTGDRKAKADVIYVVARQETADTWYFSVTVAHLDTGWEDYADGWDVVLPSGTVVKPDPGSPFTRLLLHPHETEQPFTRGQGGIVIPQGVKTVTVRAHDLVDGFGGGEILVDLTVDRGQDFEVQR
jgi:hypothetical protein